MAFEEPVTGGQEKTSLRERLTVLTTEIAAAAQAGDFEKVGVLSQQAQELQAQNNAEQTPEAGENPADGSADAGPTAEEIEARNVADQEQRQGEIKQADDLAELIKKGEDNEGRDDEAFKGAKDLMKDLIIKVSGFSDTTWLNQVYNETVAAEKALKAIGEEGQRSLAEEIFNGMNHLNHQDAQGKAMVMQIFGKLSPFGVRLRELENTRRMEAGYSPIE